MSPLVLIFLFCVRINVALVGGSCLCFPVCWLCSLLCVFCPLLRRRHSHSKISHGSIVMRDSCFFWGTLGVVSLFNPLFNALIPFSRLSCFVLVCCLVFGYYCEMGGSLLEAFMW